MSTTWTVHSGPRITLWPSCSAQKVSSYFHVLWCTSKRTVIFTTTATSLHYCHNLAKLWTKSISLIVITQFLLKPEIAEPWLQNWDRVDDVARWSIHRQLLQYWMSVFHVNNTSPCFNPLELSWRPSSLKPLNVELSTTSWVVPKPSLRWISYTISSATHWRKIRIEKASRHGHLRKVKEFLWFLSGPHARVVATVHRPFQFVLGRFYMIELDKGSILSMLPVGIWYSGNDLFHHLAC